MYYSLHIFTDHEKEVKAEREKNRSMRLARREQIREKQIAELREKVGTNILHLDTNI